MDKEAKEQQVIMKQQLTDRLCESPLLNSILRGSEVGFEYCYNWTKSKSVQEHNQTFSILIWNKKEDRPATNKEIQFLINGDDGNGQLFLAWNKVCVTKEDLGQIHLHIDSGEEDNYEIRYLVTEAPASQLDRNHHG